jgi:transcriptional regulator with XRE-family HTH domain
MDRDLKSLQETVRQAMDRTGLPKRRLEEELGIGHGTLEQLVSGRLEIKARHLLAIARFLRVPPHQLLELGCPEAEGAANQDLGTLLGLPAREAARQEQEPAVPEERIRAIVREELLRLLGGGLKQSSAE